MSELDDATILKICKEYIAGANPNFVTNMDLVCHAFIRTQQRLAAAEKWAKAEENAFRVLAGYLAGKLSVKELDDANRRVASTRTIYAALAAAREEIQA